MNIIREQQKNTSQNQVFQACQGRRRYVIKIFNKYQVQFDDGKSYQFLAKGDFKRKIGDFVEYEITNQQYGTAKLIYTQPQATPNKDVTISKLACLKAAAEFNAGRPQSDRVSVVEDA